MTIRGVVMRALLAILLIATALVAVLAGPPARQRFSSGVEVVRVDVLVSERGRPVRGLTAADFEVRDNGVPQEVTLVGFERVRLNVVLVLDLSASVAGDRLEDLQRAGRALVARLSPDDRAAIIGFSHMLILGSGLTQDRARLLALLNSAKPAGDTALVDATYAGMMIGESEEGRSLVMVFSDGLDVSSWLTASRVVDAAKRSETVVYGVSMKGSRPPFLEQMTTQTGGRLLDVDSRNLSDTFLGVLNEFRERYLLSYSPRGVSREGWHALDVTVKKRKATVKARPGYLAGR
jgi:Ca-activated chloride channel homolog